MLRRIQTRLWVRFKFHDSRHPTAESETHASLSHAADTLMRENAFVRNVSDSGLFDLASIRSIEMLTRTLPLPNSNNSSTYIWSETTTSSRAKVSHADATFALDLNVGLLNSCVTRNPVGVVKSSSLPWVGS